MENFSSKSMVSIPNSSLQIDIIQEILKDENTRQQNLDLVQTQKQFHNKILDSIERESKETPRRGAGGGFNFGSSPRSSKKEKDGSVGNKTVIQRKARSHRRNSMKLLGKHLEKEQIIRLIPLQNYQQKMKVLDEAKKIRSRFIKQFIKEEPEIPQKQRAIPRKTIEEPLQQLKKLENSKSVTMLPKNKDLKLPPMKQRELKINTKVPENRQKSPQIIIDNDVSRDKSPSITVPNTNIQNTPSAKHDSFELDILSLQKSVQPEYLELPLSPSSPQKYEELEEAQPDESQFQMLNPTNENPVSSSSVTEEDEKMDVVVLQEISKYSLDQAQKMSLNATPVKVYDCPRRRKLNFKEMLKTTNLKDLEQLIDDKQETVEDEPEDKGVTTLINQMAQGKGHPHALAKLYGGICRDHGKIHKPGILGNHFQNLKGQTQSLLVIPIDAKSAIIKQNKAPNKYMCSNCHKKLIHDIKDYYEVEGDVQVPKIIDHLSRLRLFQRVKQIFVEEINHYRQENQHYIQQNKIMYKMLQKWTTQIIQQELQESSQDLRAIHTKKVDIGNFIRAINPYEYQKENIIYHQSKKKKTVKKWVPEEPPEEMETFIDPIMELGLINKEILEKSLRDTSVNVDAKYFNEMQQEIQNLKEINKQLKTQLKVVNQYKLFEIQTTSSATANESIIKHESSQSSSNGEENHLENYFAQMQSMSPITKQKLPQIQLKFQKLDMNQPENLRQFMRILGIPFRPYKEIMQEISLFIESKQEAQRDETQKYIDKLNEEIKTLKNQLSEKNTKPRDEIQQKMFDSIRDKYKQQIKIVSPNIEIVDQRKSSKSLLNLAHNIQRQSVSDAKLIRKSAPNVKKLMMPLLNIKKY